MTEPDGVVFVVDDDASFRESLKDLIHSIGLRVEEFASAEAFLRSKRLDMPGCLVLDVRLKGLSGLDLQKRMAEADIEIPIIFITGRGDIPMTVQAMKAGAVEFLPKPFGPEELLTAIRTAIERSRTLLVSEADLQTLRDRNEALTVRERDVLALVVQGLLK